MKTVRKYLEDKSMSVASFAQIVGVARNTANRWAQPGNARNWVREVEHNGGVALQVIDVNLLSGPPINWEDWPDEPFQLSGSPAARRRKAPATPIDASWAFGQAERAAAAKAGITAENAAREFRRFVDWHQAHGSTMSSWPAAWRTWIGRLQDRQAVRGRKDGELVPD